MEDREVTPFSLKKPGPAKAAGFLLFFAALGLCVWLYTEGRLPLCGPTKPEIQPASESIKYINVRVLGEVSNPGPYRLKPDSTIKEAIEKAGGFTRKADPARMDLSLKVTPGQKVIVPARKGFFAGLGIGKSPPEEYINPELKIEKTE